MFKEIIGRFLAKNPKFFKILQLIGIILAVVCGLPEFLASNGIELPEAVMVVANKWIGYFGAIMAFISQFTVDTPQATKEALEKKVG